MSISTSDRNAEVVVPSDTVNLAEPSRALYIGVSGKISVEMAGVGSAIVFLAVPVGVLQIEVTRVNATNTDATDMVALR